MDPIKNPYQPGAGCRPPELVGRDSVIDQARILLGRVAAKRAEKSILLTGLRGVGKTVLLVEMQSLAEKNGYLCGAFEAHEGKRLTALLVPVIRKILIRLSTRNAVTEKIKSALAALAGFVESFKVAVDDVTFGLNIRPSKGIADSGDIEQDLPELFRSLGEAAEDAGSPVALFIDELQYFDGKELSSLIMSIHKIQQLQLPIVLFGAGLPILPSLAGESKSYAERLFSFPDIGPLTEKDSEKAIREPARSSGVVYDNDAIREIFRCTKGYPYFIQEWGYQCWNRASTNTITADVVLEATAEALDRLDNNFFRVRFDRCTHGEKDYLHTIAKLGEGPQSTGDIAKAKNVKIQTFGPVRSRLIKKGMIYSPYHGDVDFTVPLFGDFMLRTMAKQPPTKKKP
jgi:hypothetical protein